LKLGYYKHYKDKDYEVLGIVKHSETCEDYVHYKALYGEGLSWVRPASMFSEQVTIEGVDRPRFEYLGPATPEALCRPFHAAFPVASIEKAKSFYTDVLGCKQGRSDTTWVDLDLYGHQLVFHLNPDQNWELFTNPVDDHAVPVPHFGVVLTMPDWQALAKRLKDHGISFMIEPYIRFKGQAGEQATMFFLDPNGLALEFKAFADDAQIFAT